MATSKFQDLNLSNAFLFAVTLENPENCGLVLEMLLERSMGKVTVQTERSLLFTTEARYVRLDVYASDKTGINYNVEMQNENEENLPKRARYHQAELDLSLLKPGEDFNALKPSVIIFICAFDPFGENLYRYTFEHRCKERGLPLGDETKVIFFNTKGKNDDEVPEQLVHFLKYLENTTDAYVGKLQDPKVQMLHSGVKAIKQSRKLEERYMQFEEMLNKREIKGREQGREEGRQINEISLIEKKAAKGLPPEVIAEHLEMDIAFVQKVCKFIQEHPEATDEELFELLSLN